MNPVRRRRLAVVLLLVSGVSVAVALGLYAFSQNLLYFFTPTQVQAGEAPQGRAFRLGGLVTEGSVQRETDGVTVRFDVTDTAATQAVRFKGILPDLFREGQGVIAQGELQDGVFVANEVLAKHDENYMPPEVADALEKAGAMPKHEMSRNK